MTSPAPLTSDLINSERISVKLPTKMPGVPVRQDACPTGETALDGSPSDHRRSPSQFEGSIPDVFERIRAANLGTGGRRRDQRPVRAAGYDRECLTRRPDALPPAVDNLDCPAAMLRGALTAPSATRLRQLLRARNERNSLFGADLFADPAWDILLVLAIALLEDRPISVTSAIHAAGVSGTTGLRYIDLLASQGLVTRIPDPNDRRRQWLTLSPRATVLLIQHFAKPGAWS